MADGKTEYLHEINTKVRGKESVPSSRNRAFSMPASNVFQNLQESKLTKYRFSVSGWTNPTTASSSQNKVNGTDTMRDNLDFVSRLPVVSLTKPSFIKPIKPRPHKAKILIWSELTLDMIYRLNECHNYDSIKQMLATIFLLDSSEHNLKNGIILDLYYQILLFAREEKFSPEKTSTFFAIIKKTFEVCIETPYGNMDHAFQYFKELLFCHSVDHPPVSIELFTTDEVVMIFNYTLNTLFRHFKMYKYVFTPAVAKYEYIPTVQGVKFILLTFVEHTLFVRLDLTLKYIGTVPSPPRSEADVEDTSTLEDEETTVDEDEKLSEETDAEKLEAEKELRTLVTNFLTIEAKKIEGNIEQRLKVAIDTLNAKIDPLIDSGTKNVKGKKK